MSNNNEPKVHILYENPEWLAPLAESLGQKGIPHQGWNLAEGQVDINSIPPPGVYFNKMSASSFIRGHLHAKDLTAPVLAWLEAHGRRVVNKRRALLLEMSKAEQQISLQQFGLQTPVTRVAVGKQAILEAAQFFSPAPFIIKPNQGGKGAGVALFQNVKELQNYLDIVDLESLTVDGVVLVQQYIQPVGERIVRIEFIGGRFYYAVQVNTGGSFELCPADACEIDPANPQKTIPAFHILSDFYIPEIEKCEAFLAANDIEIAGMEFMEDAQGQRYFYDVNTNTNYNTAAEEKSGLKRSGMNALTEWLAAELENIKQTQV